MNTEKKDTCYDIMLEIEDDEEFYRKVVRTWPRKRPTAAPLPKRGMGRIIARLG